MTDLDASSDDETDAPADPRAGATVTIPSALLDRLKPSDPLAQLPRIAPAPDSRRALVLFRPLGRPAAPPQESGEDCVNDSAPAPLAYPSVPVRKVQDEDAMDIEA